MTEQKEKSKCRWWSDGEEERAREREREGRSAKKIITWIILHSSFTQLSSLSSWWRYNNKTRGHNSGSINVNADIYRETDECWTHWVKKHETNRTQRREKNALRKLLQKSFSLSLLTHSCHVPAATFGLITRQVTVTGRRWRRTSVQDDIQAGDGWCTKCTNWTIKLSTRFSKARKRGSRGARERERERE